MAYGNGSAFGAVHTGTSTERDQAVAARLLVDHGGFAHGSLRRVTRRAVVNRVGHIAHGLNGGCQDAGCFDARIGHDQRLGHAAGATGLGEFLDRAKSDFYVGDVFN